MDTAGLILATYVLTLVLIQSDGPWGIIYKIRSNKFIDSFGILNCFICTSFWIALLISILAGNIFYLFIYWGGAVIIDKILK